MAVITFSKVLSMYALMQASFQSFKALHRVQKYSSLLDDHKRARKKNSDLPVLDDEAIFRALDHKEIIPLLHFWSVMAVIHLYDSYLELFVDWIPFYSGVKFVLMVWLLFPKTQGATVFFEQILIPQTDLHMKRMEERWFPMARRVVLTVAFAVFRRALDGNLESVGQQELLAVDQSLDYLTREVTREGYRRNREESMRTLHTALPDDKQRRALLADILREYSLRGDGGEANWSELRLERADTGKDFVRIRFASDMDSEEEMDWLEHDLVTPEMLAK